MGTTARPATPHGACKTPGCIADLHLCGLQCCSIMRRPHSLRVSAAATSPSTLPLPPLGARPVTRRTVATAQKGKAGIATLSDRLAAVLPMTAAATVVAIETMTVAQLPG